MKRVFIVGCPRSGTTLLQGMLAGHSEVYTLPETFFFARALPRNALKKRLSWPAIRVRKHFRTTVAELGRPDLLEMANIGFIQRDYHAPFVQVLDQIAKDCDKNVWVEKTPMHLYNVDEIQACIPDALIIHLVRNGLDVVASLVDATTSAPEQWAKFGGRRWKNWKGFTIEAAVARWNKDINITRSRIGAPKNMLIKYEDLIDEPEAQLRHICGVLELEFEKRMMAPGSTYHQIVRSDEPWKVNNLGEIGQRESKADKIFTETETAMIKKNLVHYEFE